MQASAASCSWSLQLDNLFAFGAVEKEQQRGIDGIVRFSLLAFRTDTRASVNTCQKENCASGETRGVEAETLRDKQVEWVRVLVCFEILKMEKVQPPVSSQNGDALQEGTWDGVEFPIPVNEEESCFWSAGCVLFCIELLGFEEKKLYLCERD